MRKSHGYVVLAALALTSACTGSSGKPQVLPSLTATPSQTPGPVVVPSDALPETPQALDKFVRFYFDRLNAAFSAADPTMIRALSSPECSTCENYAKSLGTDGNHVVGPTFTDVEVAAPPIQSSGTIVDVSGRIAARELADASGKVVKHLASGGAFHFQVNVTRTNGAWLVRGIRKAA